ncbi:MAG: cell division protein ZapE [Gammaproteobacteria bacterium]|nr:cell division protein ZapE [Gammaproteobacteria bacterium]
MIESAYRKLLDTQQIVQDSEQKNTVMALQTLQHNLNRHKPNATLFSRITTFLSCKPCDANIKGLYIWGGIGRGKTFLMDLFFSNLHIQNKLRLHFHKFMDEAHEMLKNHRNKVDPLKRVAREFSDKAKVLCLDEFLVNDIGDAMIISELLKGLFENNTILVTTSNIEPDLLYKNGLQRERFLPAIDLLQIHTNIIRLGGETDYRFETLQTEGVYNTPVNEASQDWLEHHFLSLSPEKNDGSWGKIQIKGRTLQAIRYSTKIAWFDFGELCAGPRSTSDYIELAKRFNTILISHVPVFKNRDDQARRFINLVDEFYDRNVKLILSAEAYPDSLYQGSRLHSEFRRTTSRLTEMQSLEYLEKQHHPDQ